MTQSAYSSESIIKLERDSKPKSTIRGPEECHLGPPEVATPDAMIIISDFQFS